MDSKVKTNMTASQNWQQSDPRIFWGEIAPCSHVVQIYEDDSEFLHTLEDFVILGLEDGDSLVLIATERHLKAIEDRCSAKGFNMNALKKYGQYIAIEAEEMMSKFMVNGWPDEELFYTSVSEVLNNARKGGNKVRAFGEMVALMWANGQQGATVRLEYLWHEFCKKEEFRLLCAYPKSGFTENAVNSIKTICATHSKIINGEESRYGRLYYTTPQY